MRIRLNGTDAEGTVSAYYESDDFAIDTAGPLGLLSLSVYAGSATSATMLWSSGITDAHFDHYELWHGANQTDVINRMGTAESWGVSDDAALSGIATISTVITGLSVTDDYYVKIWAIDDYGNGSTVADVNVFNPPNEKTLTVTSTAGGTTDPAPGSYRFPINSLIPISGIADTGYLFAHWEENGLFVSDSSGLSVLLNEDRTLTAVFEASSGTPPATQAITAYGSGSVAPDTTPPGKPVLSPPASPTRVALIRISGVAEPGSLIDLYDGGALVRRLSAITDMNGRFSQDVELTEGAHDLTVRALDLSLNTSEASDAVSVTIKTTPPQAPIVLNPKNGDRTTEATPVLIGVSEPLSRVEMMLDASSTFISTADADGAWQFKLPSDSALKDGPHAFTLIAVDLAGNTSTETLLEIYKASVPPEIIPEVPPTTPVVPAPVPPTVPNAPSAPAPAPRPSPAPAVIPPAVPATAPITETAPTPLPIEQVIQETAQSVELPGVPVPTISNASIPVEGDTFTFTGTALPNQDVIVYLHSDQAVVYRTKSDSAGVWSVRHSQNVLELAPGTHTIYAVALDPNAKVKSRPSAVSTFTVSKNFWVSLFEGLNLQTTIITLFAALSIMLWLHQIKKHEALASANV